jgi:LCP family protein required for cell wall assembly
MDYFQQKDFNQSDVRQKSLLKKVFLGLIIIAVLYGGYMLSNASNVIEVKGEISMWKRFTSFISFGNNETEDPNYVMPKKESNREDILVLGMRGGTDAESENAGRYLTDTIMLFSYDKESKRASLVSLPRDLYVKIYGKNEKLNAAYEMGLTRGDGLGYVKKLFSQISGVYVDNVIVFNFNSFEAIVDQLGGVDITLKEPFVEKQQWGYEFSLPAGKNHLDGKTALYYARSRFSSNDFDRARRQQELIFAIKEKALKMDLLAEPTKAIGLLNTVNKNVDTDINLLDVAGLADMGKNIDTSPANFKHYVVSTENLLYQTSINGIYVLLPNNDNFDGIKQMFGSVLKANEFKPQ